MKVALIAKSFPGGGGERYVQEIANRLQKNGDEAVVITSDRDIESDVYPFPVVRHGTLFSIGDYSIWTGLTNTLAKFKDYVIHINSYGYFHSDLTAFCKRFFNYNTVFTGHGFTGFELRRLGQTGNIPVYSYLKIARILRPVYDRTLGRMEIRNSDALIALSKREMEIYMDLGAHSDKIKIIPPGVNDAFFSSPLQKIEQLKEQINGAPILLSVGDLSWVKASDIPMKALPLILKEEPNALLIYIGSDKGLKSSLVDLSRKLGVQNRVLFLNYIRHEDLPAYFHLSDILLHTSLVEGLSTVLLEAMACKLPFITTPAGGNGYLVDDTGAGLLVPFNDKKAVASAVIQLWQDKSLFADIKNKAAISAPNFGWNNVFNKILKVYQEVSKR